MKAFTNLCTPAKIYLILAITGVISSMFHKFNIIYSIFSLFFVVLWTALLNWICSKGYTVISWFLVLLPLMTAFVLMGMYIDTLTK